MMSEISPSLKAEPPLYVDTVRLRAQGGGVEMWRGGGRLGVIREVQKASLRVNFANVTADA